MLISFMPRRTVAATMWGLLAAASLPACQNGLNEDKKTGVTAAASDSTARPAPVVVDTIKLKALAMRRDSLRADSIVKKSGQLPGAILPGHRIVAFYGNIRSKGMGILGREPKEQMFRKFEKVLAEWQAAEPGLPVQPALHSVTITAQAAAGKDGKYRLMNSKATIDE
ncbi:MAG TPA: hypothetical protein VF690_05480, partial [Hymenobacter sp.]